MDRVTEENVTITDYGETVANIDPLIDMIESTRFGFEITFHRQFKGVFLFWKSYHISIS